jgi:hypothetical protein
MSISTIGTVFQTAAPTDLVSIQRPNAGGFTAIDASVPMAALSNIRFDVTFTGLEFRNIGTTPLVLIQSNRAVIVTSAAVILTEQTEAFDFSAGVSITTTNRNTPQAYDDGSISIANTNAILSTSVSQIDSIGQGNAYIASKGADDSPTGDGFIRILGTYYEIDL